MSIYSGCKIHISHAHYLFAIAKLMDFGDGTGAYSIKVSHAVGDGTTFFQIVSQISSFMNGRAPSKIDWCCPAKATHEIYPETFSERDYTRSYGLPFGWGVFKVRPDVLDYWQLMLNTLRN